MNLFSIFDPYSVAGIPLNWAILLALGLLRPPILWAQHSRPHAMHLTAYGKVNAEFTAIIQNSAPGSTLMCVALIVFIVTTNAVGLIPYVFTSSSHLVFCVRLALPL